MGLIVGLIVLACALVVFAIALRISAAILRTAVSLTNAVLGGRDPDEDDFRRPAYDYNPLPRPKTLAGLRVPMPGVMYAILITIVSGVLSTAAQFGTTFAAAVVFAVNVPADGPGLEAVSAHLGAVGVGLVTGLLVSLVVLKMALPTTFTRAAVVMFWQFVISMLIGLVLCLAAYALAPGDGGRLPARMPQSNVWFK